MEEKQSIAEEEKAEESLLFKKSKFPFPKAFRLSKRKDFRFDPLAQIELCSHIKIIYSTSNQQQSRFGITVSKKWGKATKRNRIKRIIKEAFRHKMGFIPPSLNLIILPRKSIKNAKSTQIQEDLEAFIKNQKELNN